MNPNNQATVSKRSDEPTEMEWPEEMVWRESISSSISPFEIYAAEKENISISRHDFKAMCLLVNDEKSIGSLEDILGFGWPKNRRNKLASKRYILKTEHNDGQIALRARGYDVLRSIVTKGDMRGETDCYTAGDRLDLSPEHFRVLAVLLPDEPASIDTVRHRLIGEDEYVDGTHKNDDFNETYVTYLIEELCSLSLAEERTDESDGPRRFVPTAVGAFVPNYSNHWGWYGVDFLTALTANTLSVREVLNDTELLPEDEDELVDRAVTEQLGN